MLPKTIFAKTFPITYSPNPANTSTPQISVTVDSGTTNYFQSPGNVRYFWEVDYNSSFSGSSTFVNKNVSVSTNPTNGQRITVLIDNPDFSKFGAGTYTFSLWLGNDTSGAFTPPTNQNDPNYIVYKQSINIQPVGGMTASFDNPGTPINSVIGALPSVQIDNVNDTNTYTLWWKSSNSNPMVLKLAKVINIDANNNTLITLTIFPTDIINNASATNTSIPATLCLAINLTSSPSDTACASSKNFNFTPPAIYPLKALLQIGEKAQAVIGNSGPGVEFTFHWKDNVVHAKVADYTTISTGSFQTDPLDPPINIAGSSTLCMDINYPNANSYVGEGATSFNQGCRFSTTFTWQLAPSTLTTPPYCASLSIDKQNLVVNSATATISWSNVCIPNARDQIMIYQLDSLGNKIKDSSNNAIPISRTWVDCKNVVTGPTGQVINNPSSDALPRPSGNCNIGPFNVTGNYSADYVSLSYQDSPLKETRFSVTPPEVPTATPIPTFSPTINPTPDLKSNTSSGQMCDLSQNGKKVEPETALDSSKRGVFTAIGCVPVDPTVFINKVLKFAAGIGGGIALLLMASGAFQVISSAGNQEAVGKGRDQITSAFIGLLFIIFSTLLLQIIGVDILGGLFGAFSK